MKIRLASQSVARQHLLKMSRVLFTAHPARIDETSILDALLSEGASATDISATLAEYKARKISVKFPEDLVIGGDQIAFFNRKIIGKPENKQQLTEQLTEMSGEKHSLYTANILYKDGKPLWRYVAKTDLVLRDLSSEEIAEYVNEHWDVVQHCAGGYAFENTPHIFSSVKGTWFDILGLSLPNLLDALKNQGGISDASVPKLAAVLGHPIAQSRSPILHSHWLDKEGIRGNYTSIDIPPAYFDETVKTLISVGFSGFNVTIPHKIAALNLSTDQTQAAKRIGAANTLVAKDGQIHADSTDGYGFWHNILQFEPDWDVGQSASLILGAGGAARAIIDVLLSNGAPKIYLTNRTRATAQELADLFGDKVHVVEWDDRTAPIAHCSTIINTTSLGMVGKPPLELDLSTAQPNTLVTDLVYNPVETDLLKNAKTLGLKTVDGVGMLLHQAKPGFEAWFNHSPVVDDDLRKAVLG